MAHAIPGSRIRALCLTIFLLPVAMPGSAATQTALAVLPDETQEVLAWAVFSSASETHAESLKRHLRAMGLSSSVVAGTHEGRRVYRVALGWYASRAAAMRARRRLADRIPAGAWLLHLAPTDTLPLRPSPPVFSGTVPGSGAYAGALSTVSAPAGLPPDVSAQARSPLVPLDTLRVPPPSDSGSASNKNPTTPRAPFLKNLSATIRFANSFDTNIDHNADNLESYGAVPAAQLRYRQAMGRSKLMVMYLVGVHSYTRTNRWDRVSHQFKAAFEPGLSSHLRAETVADLSFKGSSEDRDISNQFQLSHTFEYRFDRNHRVQAFGTFRLKRFPGARKNNAFKPNTGLRYEQRFPSGQRWEAGARYEIKRVESPRSNYYRWTFDVEYRTPYLWRHNQLILKAKVKRKFYWTRLIKVDGDRTLRRDRRWTLGAEWRHKFSGDIQTSVGYQFEVRTSNDARKFYRAHFFDLSVAYKVWH